jgi:hypothetical protein
MVISGLWWLRRQWREREKRERIDGEENKILRGG